ncbi:hypothetical protein C5167_006152 [Papaver somniferum]|uniref:non-specific serine/threonine protein kinase n=2 Tax=Papaver somniferum TaxID=3469 RepID=A0A4Y7JGG7_PAPSO|nr:serine/threonine-protein kinase D6PK-like isoform X1 [Papaver somniferum]XP_026381530.1 serine/threonine-protein kinase D6PK-like isoform X1 [Papaver somniferum]XP_026381531.1 serine/threonine-protein kinase D6PK-like isoform X1 [Papaver somniferum]RZC58849.1 hypothetical protein C5167_006152 [Papaver somniferum]
MELGKNAPESSKRCSFSDAVSCASYATAVDYGTETVGYQMTTVAHLKQSHKMMARDHLQKKEPPTSSNKHFKSDNTKLLVAESSSHLDKQELDLPEAASEGLSSGLPVQETTRSGISKHLFDDLESCSSNYLPKPAKCVSGPCKEAYGHPNEHLISHPIIRNCQSPPQSLYSGTQYTEAQDTFAPVEISECTSSFDKKSAGSTKVRNSLDFIESGKTSVSRGSSGSNVSDESSSSSFCSAVNKPHKGNDTRWDAIQAIRSRDGALGLNHFRLLKRLGCGDIGSVYLSELSQTRSYFAMKVMDKAALASRKKLLRAQTEREILQSLDHPFLPTLYTHFETDKFSCLVMEFCPGGDLHALRQKQPGKHFSENAARFYVAEVLLAMEYLHMLGIIYRDLKPENVLVRDDGHIMLSDFDLSLRCAVCPTLVKSSNPDMHSSKKNSGGYYIQPACVEPTCLIQPSCLQPTSCFTPRFLTSKPKKDKKTKPKNDPYKQVSPLPELMAEPTSARSMSFVGTHEYLAPEIIKGEGHGSAVDWWTFGIFLYELLFGKTPFKGSGNRATLFNVVGQPLKFPENPAVSFAARDLIRGLLVKEPQHRLAYRRGATEIKQHPFFQSVNWALIRCTNPPDVPKPFMAELLQSEMSTTPKTDNVSKVDVKPSGHYLEIDFF